MSLSGLHTFIRCSIRNTAYPFFLSAASDTYNPLVPDNLPSLIDQDSTRSKAVVSAIHTWPSGPPSPKENASHDTTRSHAKPRGEICKRDTGIHTRSLAIAQELSSQ